MNINYKITRSGDNLIYVFGFGSREEFDSFLDRLGIADRKLRENGIRDMSSFIEKFLSRTDDRYSGANGYALSGSLFKDEMARFTLLLITALGSNEETDHNI